MTNYLIASGMSIIGIWLAFLPPVYALIFFAAMSVLILTVMLKEYRLRQRNKTREFNNVR